MINVQGNSLNRKEKIINDNKIKIVTRNMKIMKERNCTSKGKNMIKVVGHPPTASMKTKRQNQ